MVLLALFGLVTQDIGLVVFGCAVCVLGVVFVNVRPRVRPITGWTVLVATWALGLAMSVYGCGYVVAAVGAIGSELFLVYLITGGVSWLGGGALFVGLRPGWQAAVRRLARRRHRSWQRVSAPASARVSLPKRTET